MQVANMGNYAHGNQPAQHMIYLYNYAGQPWKAQWWAREVMDRLYMARPDGYCGDEDNGQTSAFFPAYRAWQCDVPYTWENAQGKVFTFGSAKRWTQVGRECIIELWKRIHPEYQ